MPLRKLVLNRVIHLHPENATESEASAEVDELTMRIHRNAGEFQPGLPWRNSHHREAVCAAPTGARPGNRSISTR